MQEGRPVLRDEFAGMVAVVTGAAQGIGRVIAGIYMCRTSGHAVSSTVTGAIGRERVAVESISRPRAPTCPVSLSSWRSGAEAET